MSDRSPQSEIPNEQLVAATADGDKQAFAELVKRFQHRVYGFIGQRVRQVATAEDLTQETFIRVWQHAGQFDPQYKFSTWLFTIAYRLVVSHYRKQKPTAGLVSAAATVADADSQPHRHTDARDAADQVWRVARECLSEDQYDALWLRYGEQLDPGEVADVMGKRPGNVRVLLHRARGIVAARLSSHEKQPSDAPTRERGKLKSKQSHESGGDVMFVKGVHPL